MSSSRRSNPIASRRHQSGERLLNGQDHSSHLHHSMKVHCDIARKMFFHAPKHRCTQAFLSQIIH